MAAQNFGGAGYIETIELTIAQNAAESGAFDMRRNMSAMIIVPSAWTAANIGFKVCDTETGTYVIARDETGVPIQVSGVLTNGSRAYSIPVDNLFAAYFVKLWSKSATLATETDVNQAAARAMKVMLK